MLFALRTFINAMSNANMIRQKRVRNSCNNTFNEVFFYPFGGVRYILQWTTMYNV